MSFKVVIAARAFRQMEAAREWWELNRLEAPELISHEIDVALRMLRSHPNLGARTRTRRGQTVRRVLLPKTRYVVFYRLVGKRTIRVVSLWHQSREGSPKL